MGIPFGKTIDESLPKCPYDWTKVTSEISGELCWTKNYGTYFLGGGVGFKIGGVFPMLATARQVDNKLEYIGLSFRSNFFAKVYAVLQERYGKPTEVDHPTWTFERRAESAKRYRTMDWRGQKNHNWEGEVFL